MGRAKRKSTADTSPPKKRVTRSALRKQTVDEVSPSTLGHQPRDSSDKIYQPSSSSPTNHELEPLVEIDQPSPSISTNQGVQNLDKIDQPAEDAPTKTYDPLQSLIDGIDVDNIIPSTSNKRQLRSSKRGQVVDDDATATAHHEPTPNVINILDEDDKDDKDDKLRSSQVVDDDATATTHHEPTPNVIKILDEGDKDDKDDEVAIARFQRRLWSSKNTKSAKDDNSLQSKDASLAADEASISPKKRTRRNVNRTQSVDESTATSPKNPLCSPEHGLYEDDAISLTSNKRSSQISKKDELVDDIPLETPLRRSSRAFEKKRVVDDDISTPPPKRSRRKPKKDPLSNEELFGPNSMIIDMDLHAHFAKPESWDMLDESQKEQIRALLPESVNNLNEEELRNFFKYDMGWRTGVRLFQEDVAEGRYEPEWQRQAEIAMKERAAGKFDDSKEREFEEFWGQKQKVPDHVLTGESSKITLSELVKAGIFKIDDVWSYTRTFVINENRILVEKDSVITSIDEHHITFSMPPHQYKYAWTSPATAPSHGCDEEEQGKPTVGGDGTVALEATQAAITTEGDDKAVDRDDKEPNTAQVDGPEPDHGSKSITDKPSDTGIKGPITDDTLQVHDPTPSPPDRTPISYTVKLPGVFSLERKLVEIDGRVKFNGHGSQWRMIRCKRANQDIGSLWEIRQEYFARKYPEGTMAAADREMMVAAGEAAKAKRRRN